MLPWLIYGMASKLCTTVCPLHPLQTLPHPPPIGLIPLPILLFTFALYFLLHRYLTMSYCLSFFIVYSAEFSLYTVMKQRPVIIFRHCSHCSTHTYRTINACLFGVLYKPGFLFRRAINFSRNITRSFLILQKYVTGPLMRGVAEYQRNRTHEPTGYRILTH